ncbi:MAG TPA: GxxExxY protein [Candidatus Angelobacter sp.]|nr:GxxExxY protein [Candidatus Angelobacter sp.]
MNADERRLDEITDKVIGCAFVVSNILGAGFVEKVYENALAHELRMAGLSVAQQYAIAVSYKDIIVGEYVADLLVASEVIVELKAVRALDDVHAAQCMNYLKATGRRVCLLFNFGRPRVEVRRIVLGF